MAQRKTTIYFTAEELELLNMALNSAALRDMNESETWGNPEATTEDFCHKRATELNGLWSRVYLAQRRIGSRKKILDL